MTGTGGWMKAAGDGWADEAAEAKFAEGEITDAGGEALALFEKNNGDWDRLEDHPEALLALIKKHRDRGTANLLRHEDPEIRLLRALSIVGGWSIIDMWDQLVKQLEYTFHVTKAEVQMGNQNQGRLRNLLRTGITDSAVWMPLLNQWWASSGKRGRWQVLSWPTMSLVWAQIPDEVTMGPAIVQWTNHFDRPLHTAMVNGTVMDEDAAVYASSSFFFMFLDWGMS